MEFLQKSFIFIADTTGSQNSNPALPWVPGILKIKEVKIRKAVKDAGLVFKVDLKAACKIELAVTLGHHLFSHLNLLYLYFR